MNCNSFNRTIFLFGIIITLISAIHYTSNAQSQWIYPSPGIIRSIAYGNNLYVALSTYGIFSSPDGVQWTLRYKATQEFSYTPSSISFCNDRFIALGTRIIATSQDGITWTKHSVNQSSGYFASVYGNNLFVAVGAQTGGRDGVVCISSDGQAWTEHLLASQPYLTAITYGKGLFVAGRSDGTIVTSSDGITWSGSVSISGTMILSIVYNGNTFFATTRDSIPVKSSDGLSWSKINVSLSSSYYEPYAHFVNNKIIISLNDTLLYSANGSTWNKYPSNISYSFSTILYSNSSFLACASNAGLYSSLDGVAWTLKYPFSAGHGGLKNISFNNNLFTAVGSTFNFTPVCGISLNGINWVWNIVDSNNSIEAITFGNTHFAAVGAKGSVYTSQDAAIWKKQTADTSKDLMSIIYANSRFVAGGYRGSLTTSTDGLVWIKYLLPDTNLHISSISADNNLFVALASSGEQMRGAIYNSNDGVNWTQALSVSGINFFSITHSPNLFVAVGASPTQSSVYTSFDGRSWTLSFSEPSGVYDTINSFFAEVEYLAGRFYAVKMNGAVLSSENGVAWLTIGKILAPKYSNSLPSITYGNGKFIIVWDNLICISRDDNLAVQPNKIIPSCSNHFQVSRSEFLVRVPRNMQNSNLAISIINTAGQNVFSFTGKIDDSFLRIPVRSFAKGLYFVSLSGLHGFHEKHSFFVVK